MSSDGRKSSETPVVTVVPAANDSLAPTAPPTLEPEMVVAGLRFLQQRIPELTQLSVQEKRSHARVANLDPEFIESGLYAVDAWRDTERIVQRSAEDLGRSRRRSAGGTR